MSVPTVWLLDVVVPGPPVGAARPRVVRGGTRTYMPAGHRAWEEGAVDLLWAEWMVRYGTARGARRALDEPVVLEVQAVHPRPQRLRRRRDHREAVPATRKPDLDNVVKLAMDALTKARIVVDDTRVVELHASSWYTPIDEHGRDVCEPHVRVRVALWGAR